MKDNNLELKFVILKSSQSLTQSDIPFFIDKNIQVGKLYVSVYNTDTKMYYLFLTHEKYAGTIICFSGLNPTLLGVKLLFEELGIDNVLDYDLTKEDLDTILRWNKIKNISVDHHGGFPIVRFFNGGMSEESSDHAQDSDNNLSDTSSFNKPCLPIESELLFNTENSVKEDIADVWGFRELLRTIEQHMDTIIEDRTGMVLLSNDPNYGAGYNIGTVLDALLNYKTSLDDGKANPKLLMDCICLLFNELKRIQS